MRTAASFAALVAAVAGTALAQTSSTGPTPDQLVAARQAGYDMSASVVAEMKLALKQGAPVSKQAYSAESLARWARALPAMFPVGTGPGSVTVQTRAKPEIWTDRTGFEKAAADYAAAAQKLSDLARAGDTAGFTDQLAALPKACDACHDKYKSK